MRRAWPIRPCCRLSPLINRNRCAEREERLQKLADAIDRGPQGIVDSIMTSEDLVVRAAFPPRSTSATASPYVHAPAHSSSMIL